MRRLLIGLIATAAILVVAAAAGFYLKFGGRGQPFPSIATSPILPEGAVEVVARLSQPPGNLAVSSTGRIFFTYHAESRPDVKVLELVNGKPVAYPRMDFQSRRANGEPFFDQIFNLRIDSKNRLWTLDHGFHGTRQPRLLAFDLATNQLVDRFDFPRDIAGPGSYIQDMQVDPDAQHIYVADLSAFAGKPALIVYDIASHSARRLLEQSPALMPQDWEINSKGRRMYLLGGLYWMHPGFDPIALDRHNEWLYIGAMSSDTLYRIRVKDLNNRNLSAGSLAAGVEAYARRSQCDGLSIDEEDNIYLTSIEDGAINLIDRERHQRTLVKSSLMRWPDGLSFGPEGYLYIADSDIPDVMMRTKAHIMASGPYYIFRVKTQHSPNPGQ